MSTPEMRAMLLLSSSCRPRHLGSCGPWSLVLRRRQGGSALPLLVTGVLADHEDAPVAADHLALLAHRLHAGSYLHRLLPSAPSAASLRLLRRSVGSGPPAAPLSSASPPERTARARITCSGR